eukprot:4318836-Pyramimonas_sp.AAC.1
MRCHTRDNVFLFSTDHTVRLCSPGRTVRRPPRGPTRLVPDVLDVHEVHRHVLGLALVPGLPAGLVKQ